MGHSGLSSGHSRNALWAEFQCFIAFLSVSGHSLSSSCSCSPADCPFQLSVTTCPLYVPVLQIVPGRRLLRPTHLVISHPGETSSLHLPNCPGLDHLLAWYGLPHILTQPGLPCLLDHPNSVLLPIQLVSVRLVLLPARLNLAVLPV